MSERQTTGEFKNYRYSNSNKEEYNFMNTTPQFIFGLEQIMNELVKNNSTLAKIGNVIIYYMGTKEDTAQGKREEFIIKRYIKED